MKIIVIVFSLLILAPLFVHATLEVGVTTETTGSKALVKISIKNNFDQKLKATRAWVILLDDKGKIVGQKAQWLSNPKKKKQTGNKKRKSNKTHVDLEAGDTLEASVVVNTTRPVADTKLTFSRIILGDGTLADVRKSLVAKKDAGNKTK